MARPAVAAQKTEKLTYGKARKLKQLLTKGQKFLKEGNDAEAAKYIVEAWNMNPEDFDLLVATADVMARLGVRAKALEVLERALAIHGPKPDVISVLGNLSIELEMHEVMEKLFRIYVDLRPNDPMGYNNIASALEKQDKYDDAIVFLKDVIPLFPENPALWNTLGSCVAARDGYKDAIPFYSEAYRLAPKSYNILNNISIAFEQSGEYEEALRFGREAVAVSPDIAHAHMGLATSHLALGQLAEGWREYEWRQDPRRKGSLFYTHGLPRWDGGPLDGKYLMVCPEQGLGDEILFALSYPQLIKETAGLAIGCDRRLVGLFERSFPGCRAGAYVDGFHDAYRYRSMPTLQGLNGGEKVPADLYIECGSVPLYRWHTVADLPDYPDGFLVPDPALLNKWRQRLASLGDRPKIGIYWRSGLQAGIRKKQYAPIEAWEPVFKAAPNADFINLQYGDTAAERALVKEKLGVTIHHWDDTDLKGDLEAVSALSKAVDLAIGPASAPGMFSFAVGTPTWWLLPVRPWWCFGNPDRPPFFSKGRLLVGPVDDPWATLMPRLAAELATYLGN